MASAATDLLIDKVVGILQSEASSIVGVRDQVDEIKQELISMKSFLKDVEGKKLQTEGEETWVASVRDLAYDVEDIIDKFMYHMHEQQSGGRFASLLHKTIVKGSNEMNLCASIQKMKLLRYLYLLVTSEEEFLQIDALAFLPGPPPHLQRLLLSGKLATVPSWFASLRSLTDISLRWSRLKEDILPHVEALPCLRRLILVNAYVGNELCFKIGFAKLTHLELLNFSFLKNITIKEGVMPKLQLLVLHCCMKLKALPHGLEFLRSLETLILGSVPMKIIENIREGGVDHPKVYNTHPRN
ncbi:hypothetical protein CerSpe_267900 [Prunus speciosa]